MYVRIIRGQVNAGQVDEFVKRWQAFVPTRLGGVSGLRRVYVLGDRTSNAVGTLSLWDSPPDRAALDRVVEEFLPTVSDLGSGAPTIEQYEVLAELGP